MLLLFHTLLPTLPTLYRRYKIFIFLVMINIFLAILNDAYIAIKEKYADVEVDDGPPPPTWRERLRSARAWLRQRKLDHRIERMRAHQRLLSVRERREQRKKEEARAKVLRGMGITRDPSNTNTRSDANNGL